MKILVQRTEGPVSIKCGPRVQNFDGSGLVVLLCWTKEDELRQDLNSVEDWLIDRVCGLRIFPDRDGKMNLDLGKYLESQNQVGRGGILWVSQFTLGAKLDSGFRPSFIDSMGPELAKLRFELLKNKIQANKNSQAYSHYFGEFGADMSLSFTNWGPVTIPLEK